MLPELEPYGGSSPMICWKRLDQAPMQKVRFVQRHEVAVLALLVIAAAAAAAVAAELPLPITCFAFPIQPEFA